MYWHGILFEEPNPTGSRPRDLIGLEEQHMKPLLTIPRGDTNGVGGNEVTVPSRRGIIAPLLPPDSLQKSSTNKVEGTQRGRPTDQGLTKLWQDSLRTVRGPEADDCEAVGGTGKALRVVVCAAPMGQRRRRVFCRGRRLQDDGGCRCGWSSCVCGHAAA